MRIKIMLLSLLATLIIADGRARGYMLVFQGGYCGGLGQTLGTDIVDPQDCYRLAKKSLSAAVWSMPHCRVLWFSK